MIEKIKEPKLKKNKKSREFIDSEEILFDTSFNVVFRYGILFIESFEDFVRILTKIQNIKIFSINDLKYVLKPGQAIVICGKDYINVINSDFTLNDKDYLEFINNKPLIIHNGLWSVMQPDTKKIENTIDIGIEKFSYSNLPQED